MGLEGMDWVSSLLTSDNQGWVKRQYPMTSGYRVASSCEQSPFTKVFGQAVCKLYWNQTFCCLRRWCGQRRHSQHSGNDRRLTRTKINLHINSNSTQIIDNITACVGRSGNISYLYDGNILKHFHSFQAFFCFECSVNFCQPKQDVETSVALI